MRKQDILKIMSRRLTKNNIEEKDIILEWLSELIEDEPEKKNDIILYMEKQYEKRYPDEIFIERPIPPKLRLEVSKFQILNSLEYQQYTKFVEWLVFMCETTFNRKPIPYDLCNEVLYKKFKEREEKDSEVIVEKKLLNKNRLIRT